MESLPSKIESFLRTGEGNFETLALELFAYQFDKNRAYQAWCRSQDASPKNVRAWQEIPAVPIGAFKSAELATFPIGRASAVFESSATTTGRPSRHYIKDLRYYETSLKSNFAKWVLNESSTRYYFLMLTPPPAEAPRSSLSWMMDVAKRSWGQTGSDYFIQRGRLDEPRLLRALKNVENSGQPVVLLGTTIAFLAFFDYCRAKAIQFQLPAGSRMMDTGGMKTQKREVTRRDFVRIANDVLGIEERFCINEYGMCELGSQFYGRGASSYLEGPPWTRTLVMDGCLRHFDLANVDSVMAIQTEDQGRMEGKGFLFLGRASQADLKGCSLSAETFVS